GERMVLLASMVHVLGLVGGLLNGLHNGVELVIPERLTADGILAAAAAGGTPTTILGGPFHAELLTAVTEPPALPQLGRMGVARGVPAGFAGKYGVPLGTMYGMTEVGMIATDLDGTSWPSVQPAYGIEVRVADGELQVRRPASPYVGLVDPTRFAGGWLHTRD